MENTTYQPINCNYYDRLEAWATKGELLTLDYTDPQNQEAKKVEVQLKDLQTRNKAEYAIFSNGLELRLDYILGINGLPLATSC